MLQEENDQQWKQAMEYLSAVNELNYMTQIVIMLYEDNNKVCFLSLCPEFHSHGQPLNSWALFCVFVCVFCMMSRT